MADPGNGGPDIGGTESLHSREGNMKGWGKGGKGMGREGKRRGGGKGDKGKRWRREGEKLQREWEERDRTWDGTGEGRQRGRRKGSEREERDYSPQTSIPGGATADLDPIS